MAQFRIIPRLETYPGLVRFAQTQAGKAVLLGIFGTALSFTLPYWLDIIFSLALLTAFPAYRRALLSICTVAWAYHRIWWQTGTGIFETTAVFFVAGLLFFAARRNPNSHFGRRPVAYLLGGFVAAVMLTRTIFYLPALWSFLAVFSTYLWCIAYSLRDARNDTFALQLGVFRPIWGSTNTPFPKGASYLRRIEAKSPQELAVAQLKGIKLFLWSIVLALFHRALSAFTRDYLQLPSVAELCSLNAAGRIFPAYVGWASVMTECSVSLLELSIVGHQIIACCRMAGFMALRNTYRPLAARSLVEFWSRSYYYYKELLAEFFFYPAFFSNFLKKRPRIRMTGAVFAAVFFGNSFFHFFRDIKYIEDFGFFGALNNFRPFLFYSFFLAVIIAVSAVRRVPPPAGGWLRTRFLPFLSVIGFYCIASVFSGLGGGSSLEERFRFLAKLFLITP